VIPLPAALLATLAPLRGKVIRIELAGVRLGPQFTVAGSCLLPVPFGAPDVTVRAGLRDYVSLALGREDPDTLFFSRRLVVEGDTELGLILKNALDAYQVAR
jgi:predicted lipid carrier protein YhbT